MTCRYVSATTNGLTRVSDVAQPKVECLWKMRSHGKGNKLLAGFGESGRHCWGYVGEVRRLKFNVSKIFACLCVVLRLTLGTRVPGKQPRPIILQGDQIDQELSLIRLDRQSISFDVAATVQLATFRSRLKV